MIDPVDEKSNGKVINQKGGPTFFA